ncbi:MAG: hypothetical protein ABRQ38_10785 [Candidatus Eremiobacterota bacterium]
MEEVLKQILNKLDIMGKDIKELKTNVTRLEDGQRKLEEGQTKLEEGQRKLEEGQRKLEKNINDNLELVIEEQHRIYNSLDGKLDKVLEHIKGHEIRISALEARI